MTNEEERTTSDILCEQCGGPHYIDTSLPSEIWNQIKGDDSVLCPSCIDKRLVAAGLNASAEFYFAGIALGSKSYTISQGDIEHLHRHAQELADVLYSQLRAQVPSEVVEGLYELAKPRVDELRMWHESQPASDYALKDYESALDIFARYREWKQTQEPRNESD
jgi:hypothetical protein